MKKSCTIKQLNVNCIRIYAATKQQNHETFEIRYALHTHTQIVKWITLFSIPLIFHTIRRIHLFFFLKPNQSEIEQLQSQKPRLIAQIILTRNLAARFEVY